MKSNAFHHPKLKMLGLELGLPRYACVGIMECLWEFTKQYAPTGFIGRWSKEQIAEDLGWSEEGDLIGSMINCGLIDDLPGVGLVVHDWAEHAEDSVHLKLARTPALFADGSRPKTTRLSEKEREKVDQQLDELSSETDVRTDALKSALGSALPSPPIPSPPSPSIERTSARPTGGGEGSLSEENELASWWNDHARTLCEPPLPEVTISKKDVRRHRLMCKRFDRFRERVQDALRCLRSDRKVSPSLGWILRAEKNAQRLLEGEYSSAEKTKANNRRHLSLVKSTGGTSAMTLQTATRPWDERIDQKVAKSG